jgi:BlaI family transcriptional regulator, penicillinase repressor
MYWGKDNGYTTTLKQMQLMTKGLLIRGEHFGSHVYEASVPKGSDARQRTDPMAA